jgi:hypothetical protein
MCERNITKDLVYQVIRDENDGSVKEVVLLKTGGMGIGREENWYRAPFWEGDFLPTRFNSTFLGIASAVSKKRKTGI